MTSKPPSQSCWWLVKIGEKPYIGNHVIWAKSESEIRTNFRWPVSRYRVTPLSWRGLAELTGCHIPVASKPEDLACCELIVSHKNRTVSICPTSDVTEYAVSAYDGVG